MAGPQPNAATRIERALTHEILRGSYGAGTRLPTVRALAKQFDVNPATVQRALARLGMRGLVEARQGSGTLVRDPASAGDLSLVPAWLVAVSDDPPRATAILADFLEVRRVLAARLVVRHRAALLEALPELGLLAADLLAAGDDVDALRDADLAFARALMARTGNHVVLPLLNTAQELLERVPLATAAMYAEPHTNAASLVQLLAVLQADREPDALALEVERLIAMVDAATVRRFRALLEAAK